MHLAAGRHENVCRCAALVRPFEDAVRDLLAPLPADPQGVDVENGGDLAQGAGARQPQLWLHRPGDLREPADALCDKTLRSNPRTENPHTCAVEGVFEDMILPDELPRCSCK